MKKAGSITGIVLPVIIGGGGLLAMSVIARLLQTSSIPLWMVSPHKVVNFTFTMQFMVLPISLLALLLMYLFNRENFSAFFNVSRFSPFWPLNEGSANWRFLGPTLAFGFSFGTTVLMSAGVVEQHGAINASFFKLLPLVLLFAAINAWSEEIFSRFVIVAGLTGRLNPVLICWISAVLFGIPHFFGTPNGVPGMITSGLLGWLLAKSVIETRSLGWALLIHFLQDVIIFGAGAMIIAAQ